MKTYKDLSINDKINVKQYCINTFGKRYHVNKPNFFMERTDELSIVYILSCYFIPKNIKLN